MSVVTQLQAAVVRHLKTHTVRDLAAAAGVSPGQISRIANGTNVPNLDTAERLAKAIGGRIVLKP